MMKRLLIFLAVLCLLLSGCSKAQEPTAPTVAAQPNTTVGICLPDFSWSEQAELLQKSLEAAGYQVLMEYAASDLQQQCSQVQTFVNMPVGCLVVAAVDSVGLAPALTNARQEGVPVIALDRMLMYTDSVIGCVAPDSYAAGKQTGQYIVTTKNLDAAQELVTIEFIMGAPENHSALLFYQGVMDQLQPYLQAGILKCLSGRTAFEDACIHRETTLAASDRCFGYLAEFYTAAAPDVLCCASDTLAAGCMNALESFGLEAGEQWPLITGFGATEDGLENIANGNQSISFYTDPEARVEDCVRWVKAAIAGEILTAEEAFNGVVQVPCKLHAPILVDAKNCKEFLEK